MRMTIVVLVLICLAGGAGGWYWHSSGASTVDFRTARVERGDLLETISATGTVEPDEVIDVGAQVAGLIQSFGKDANGKQIDYRSPVEPNMILARIDDAVYKADVDTARAQLDQAKANVQKGRADLDTANAKLFQAERNWRRAEKIGPSDALSQNDYDMYKAEYETGKANVAVAEAEIAQAQTGIAQGQASLDKAQRNLDFCTIRSPVKGVIIDRRVNIGQTVVSSLNAPSLFLIGKDMTRMQIWTAVNEADIGHIKPGMPVRFTCDAFPERSFNATVGKIRWNATMTQNVVTYTVEVEADNSENVLLPYLTANVNFVLNKDPSVLLVPNAALRWYPTTANEVVPDSRSSWKPIDQEEREGSAEDHSNVKGEKEPRKPRQRHTLLWVKAGELVRPVEVTVGPTDGVNTEITADQLKEGEEIVVGEVVPTSQGGERNPFLPQFKKR